MAVRQNLQFFAEADGLVDVDGPRLNATVLIDPPVDEALALGLAVCQPLSVVVEVRQDSLHAVDVNLTQMLLDTVHHRLTHAVSRSPVLVPDQPQQALHSSIHT